MKVRHNRVALFLASCLLFCSVAAAQTDSLRQAVVVRLDSLFRQLVSDRNLNGAMLVADGSGVCCRQIHGLSRLSGGQPLHAHSQFEIASLSKQFTAVSILMLYEEGRLRLEDSVTFFFPDFPYHGITVRQLLCHRSGLPDYLEFAPDYWKGEEWMDNWDLMRMMREQRPEALFDPDTRFEYSNTGYAVLACIVEKVSGMSFTDFVFWRIFDPLQMSDTYFYVERCHVPANYTIGHKRNKSPYIRDMLSGVLGDKGIMTTTDDLYRWFSHLPYLIRKETLEMAWTPKNEEMDPCANYGFGWRLACDSDGNRLVYHGGLWNGYNALLVYRPSDQTLVIFLTNWVNRAILHQGDAVLEIMGDYHRKEKEKTILKR
ncbi:MAG: beta-lactamase family protein [Bacteroidales bacterium]|nr:beta-lactamase family protein [Bacteroidales bacterium]